MNWQDDDRDFGGSNMCFACQKHRHDDCEGDDCNCDCLDNRGNDDYIIQRQHQIVNNRYAAVAKYR